MIIDAKKLAWAKAKRLGASSAAAPPPASQQELDIRLLDSAMLGRPEAVARWLAAGADPRARDTAGFTALMCSAFVGCMDSVRLLLPVSDLSATDPAGNDVYACAERSPEARALRREIMAFHRSQIERRSIESQCGAAPRRKSRMGL